MSATVRPNKNAVEVEKWRYKRERLAMYRELGTRAAQAVSWAVILASLWIPLTAVQGIIEPLAGRETIINANIFVSVGVSVSIAINVGQAVVSSSRKKRLEEARDRTDYLEQRLGIMKGEV